MENNMYCTCNSCHSIFNYNLLESPCPFCNSELNYKESENIKNYFSIPKLNNPNDYLHPSSIDNLPFTRKVNKNYLIRNNNFKMHLLHIIPIYKNINGNLILTNLTFSWDNDFNNNSFAIVQDMKDSLKYNLESISYNNIFNLDETNYRIEIYTKLVPNETYDRFLRNIDEFNNSFNISDVFSLYNSINWNLLDDMRERKTLYEYASINYLLHIFEFIHVPNIDYMDYDTKLLSFNEIKYYMNFDNLGLINNSYNKQEFLQRFINNAESPFLEDISFNDYEDIYEYFSTFKEGAVAPNAVGLNSAAQRSSTVFNKLYDLGYNPKMQIYSIEDQTSLCPTFEKNNKVYYIECNENIMKGINEFESIDDMKDILNEIYNEENADSIFISINGLTSDILSFILNNSKNNKEFLTRLIDLNNKNKENFIYSQTVQDEDEFNKGVLANFKIKEMNPQNLFKYGNTFYKLRNCKNLAGNQHGIIFIDKNENIVGYIIVEDKVYNTSIGNRTFHVVTTIESASNYKNKNMELEMINYIKKRFNYDNLRVESRNFDLNNRLENTNLWNKIENNNFSFNLYEFKEDTSLNETIVLNEAINANKRKLIEEKIYTVFNLLDKTGSNTERYRNLFKPMSNEQFDKFIKEFLKDDKRNFYLEVLPNKNCPRIKDCKEALEYLKVPCEEYLYYRHDNHKDNPIRTRYKVPILYINLRRLQQMLSKKNTYTLDISKRNMKTG